LVWELTWVGFYGYPIDIIHDDTTATVVDYDENLDIGEFSYDVKTAVGYEVKGAGNN